MEQGGIVFDSGEGPLGLVSDVRTVVFWPFWVSLGHLMQKLSQTLLLPWPVAWRNWVCVGGGEWWFQCLDKPGDGYVYKQNIFSSIEALYDCVACTHLVFWDRVLLNWDLKTKMDGLAGKPQGAVYVSLLQARFGEVSIVLLPLKAATLHTHTHTYIHTLVHTCT